MNKLLLIIYAVIGINLTISAQKVNVSQNENPYFAFRSQNMFSIIQSSDATLKEYTVLKVVELFDNETKEKISLTPEEFIMKFNAGEINSNLLNVKRERYSDTWYRLGNTDYVLVGYSEDQISNKYNQTIKK